MRVYRVFVVTFYVCTKIPLSLSLALPLEQHNSAAEEPQCANTHWPT